MPSTVRKYTAALNVFLKCLFMLISGKNVPVEVN